MATTRGKKSTTKRAAHGGRGGKRGNGGAGAAPPPPNNEQPIALHEAAQTRYLNYSLSVITSRALPDVRDGLKPVQRRILYTLLIEGMLPDGRPRKCAAVVGTALKLFHPHGDTALYEALVRLAQDWVMRIPLVEGQGNFGSMDGDPPAAYRYTECKLSPDAMAVLSDIKRSTVPFRPNFDNARTEPVVLPARFPNLLVNGAAGIAVGMATNIPPHNLGETIRACFKVLDDPEIQDYRLVTNDGIQGPDFPTGGHVLTTKEELRQIYRDGSGSIKIRAHTEPGESRSRGTKSLVIKAIPYGINKAALHEQIAQVVLDRKLPQLVDVQDFSDADVHLELTLKDDADESKVLAYLHKHTNLQINYSYNLTCLVPTENPGVCAPARLGLKEMLWHFLHFRFEVVTRRLGQELQGLEARLHILEGFRIVFDALDQVIRIIRNSDGKADSAKKILAKFKSLDELQVDAILELKLYRIAKLEIDVILDELKAKKKRAREIKKLLADDETDTTGSGRWGIVRTELQEILDTRGKGHANRRLTAIDIGGEDEADYSEEDFIIAEDCTVLVTRDGWVKRQREIKEPSKSRIRDGDEVLACVAGSTRATIAFFSSHGTCYTSRFIDVPASKGYGEPIQKLFKLKDGEHIVSVLGFDERTLWGDVTEDADNPDACPPMHGFAATSDGYALRFALDKYVPVSTRAGRRFARPAAGHHVVGTVPTSGFETVIAVTMKRRVLLCASEEVNYLSGPGKGVQLIKLGKGDRMLGFKLTIDKNDGLEVETDRGARKTISPAKYRSASRAGTGTEIQKTGSITRIVPGEVTAPILEEPEA